MKSSDSVSIVLFQSEDISMEDLNCVIMSIEMELSMQKANIALNNCESYITHNQLPIQPTCFIYEKSQASKPKQLPFSPEVSNGLSVDTIKEIEQEIQGLHSLVDHLQHEVEAKQDQFKSQMQDLSTKFENAICIPPVERKVYAV